MDDEDEKPKERNPHLAPMFSTTQQPKKVGRKAGGKNSKDLVNMLLESHIATVICDDEVARAKFNQVAEHLGEHNSSKLMMYIAMIDKAVNSKDVAAFNAVMDRAEGKPVQKSVTITAKASLEDALLNMGEPDDILD